MLLYDSLAKRQRSIQCVWSRVCNLKNVQNYTIFLVIQGDWPLPWVAQSPFDAGPMGKRVASSRILGIIRW